jgi:hypothetical protein
MVIQLGFAQVRTEGVSQCDWLQYELTLDWEHDLEVTPEDFIFTDFLQGDYAIMTIQNISETMLQDNSLFTLRTQQKSS